LTQEARVRVLDFIAVAVTTLAASNGVAQSASPESIRIGLSGPFSGGSAPMGESMRNGIRLAAMEMNLAGGILGRKIELIERDDEANPQRGAAIAKEFVQEVKVAATVGIVNTGVGLSSIEIYQQAKTPLIVAVSTGSALTRRYAPPNAPENYIFRVSPRTDLETEFLIQEALKRRLTKLAILADATPYGDAGLADLLAAMNRRGVAPAAVERYKIGDTTMVAQLERARAAGAQAIVTYGIGPELAVIAKDRARMNWQVPLLGSWTLSMRNFIDGAGRAGEGALTPQTFIQEAGSVQRNGFLIAYINEFKIGRISSPMSAAQGYDAMYLLAAAIRQARSTDGTAIKEALESLQRPHFGVITVYEKPFSKTDHDAITLNMLTLGEVRGGRVVYAYREDEGMSFVVRRPEESRK
jgi:branched-chain amino acid transport system substrate-binding protein